MKVEISNNLGVIAEDLARGVRDFSARRFNELGDETLQRAIDFAEERLNLSRPERSGRRYTSSIKFDVGKSGDKIRVTLKSNHPAADIIENGSRPHVIPPRPGGRLRYPAWRAYKRGRRFTGNVDQAVEHPGTDGYHILESAMRSVAGRQRRIVARVKS